jgi:biopolymer transport protein ExbD
MSRSSHSHQQHEAPSINITPLLDMIFIILIFFVVTSSFVKEAGVEIVRPDARTAVPQERANIMIAVTRDGEVWIDRQRVDPRTVRSHVARLHAEHPEGSVVVLADDESRTGLVVQVVDQARLAGVNNVAVATRENSGL